MFLLTGALLVIQDVVFRYCDSIEVSMQVMLLVQIVCKLSITCFWVFVCNENVKAQLKAKYPWGIGRFLNTEDRNKTASVLWKKNNCAS